MAEPAQPKQPGKGTGPDKPVPGKSRMSEFSRGRGRPRLSVHKVNLESLRSSLPGIHKIGK